MPFRKALGDTFHHSKPCIAQISKRNESYLELYRNRTIPSMASSKAHNVDNRKQKQKTIFSVDARLSRAQVESGPGECGDGVGIIAPMLPVSSSVSHGGKQVQVGLERQTKPSDGLGDLKGRQPKPSGGFVFADLKDCQVKPSDGLGDADLKVAETSEPPKQKTSPMKRPMLKALNGYIGILPESELESSKYENRGTFDLILRRLSSNKNKRDFRELIQIHNMSEFLHGYKVCFNESACFKFEASPPIGLIKPNEQISVEMCTKRPLSVGTRKYDIANDKIEIKVFRFNYSDPDRQERYFEKLEDQRPDLLSTQPIERITLWESDKFFDDDLLESITCTDADEETNELTWDEEKLLNDSNKLGQYPPPPPVEKPPSQTSSNSLIAVKNQMLITDANMKETVRHLGTLADHQYLTNLLILFTIGLAVVINLAYAL